LRRDWADRFGDIGQRLTSQAWNELGLKADSRHVTVFNPLSFIRDILVESSTPAETTGVRGKPSQFTTDGSHRKMVFVATDVPAFGFREYIFETNTIQPTAPPFIATPATLEGPFYRLRVDPANGGLASLIHKASGQEIINENSGRALCQTVFNDGQERLLSDVECQIRLGPVRSEMRVTGRAGDLIVTNVITLYAALDRVDFDVRIEKPVSTNEQRLLHFFPIGDGVRDLRIETTAAVLRPRLQPDGDLLPGADLRRFAVQGFVDYSPPGHIGVTVAPLDAFMLRMDQGALAFEALGNDQNWKEVTQNQDGETHFRFRYSLQAHPTGYNNAAVLAWSRNVAAPLTLTLGRLPRKWLDHPYLEVNPMRALVTCMKPADDGAPDETIVRLRETSGRTGMVMLAAPGFHAAWETDLLERDRQAMKVTHGKVLLNARGQGFSGMKLIQ
jgi:alpha-mannosidase